MVKPTDREADRGLQPIAIDPPRRHIVSPILGGIGGAAALAATLFEVSAYMKYATLRDTCAPPNGLGCTEDEISLVSSRANTGVGLYIGAGVVGVAAILAAIAIVAVAQVKRYSSSSRLEYPSPSLSPAGSVTMRAAPRPRRIRWGLHQLAIDKSQKLANMIRGMQLARRIESAAVMLADRRIDASLVRP